MKFKMIHENYNVSDLDRSIKFYNEALDLHEVRRKTTDDFIIVYLSNDVSDFELELTWLKDHPQPYNLGECEFHLAFQAENYEVAHKKHEEMGNSIALPVVEAISKAMLEAYTSQVEKEEIND